MKSQRNLQIKQKNHQFSLPISTFLTLILCLITIGQNANAEEYPYTYRSGYFLGRGDTGISMAENEDAIFYNPAGLAMGKGLYKKTILVSPMIEFSNATRGVIREIAVEGRSPTATLRSHEGQPNHFGLNQFTGLILRRAAIGAFINNSTTMMLYKSPTVGSMESISLSTIASAGATFSLAQDYWNQKLLVGMTGKFLFKAQAAVNADASAAETLADAEADQFAMQGQGVGVDFGLMYRPESRNHLSIGLTIQDLGNTTMTPSVETSLSKEDRALKDNLQTINFGISIAPSRRASKLKLLFDYRDIGNNLGYSPYSRVHLGAELNVKDIVGVTAGINQGYPTAGFFTDLYIFRFDLGFYTEEVDTYIGRRPDTRYFVKIAAGL
jgi:hypothetical protein